MRILVVEDEKKVADFIVRGLRAESYATDRADDGQIALEMSGAATYDLIILDLQLPRIAGLDVLKKIRLKSKHVPILILTARDATAEKVLTFEAGADDYLTKPFAFAELLVRVKALFRRSPITRSNQLKVGNLELERLTRQVTRGSNRIDLTAKEYALLEYLMLNAGRVLSRTMILEHVWDQSFQGLTNIVDVYIQHLRSKLDEPNGDRLIQTVRGVGYSMNTDRSS